MLLIRDLSIRVAGRLLIDHTSVQLPANSRVGFVGRNGTGKTTLFRAIAGELSPETGSIILPSPHAYRPAGAGSPGWAAELWSRWCFRQMPSARSCWPRPIPRAIRTGSRKSMRASWTSTRIPLRRGRLPSWRALASRTEAQQRPVGEFSGGWRMRVALAAVLFSEPDLLLLDEPTNYLDLEGTLWLEDHLARYPKSLIVISHDRDLLDNSVDHILHLGNEKLTLYRGGYSSFARQRAERQQLDAKTAKKQEAQRKHLQAFVDRFKAKASKAKQAQSRVKLLAKLVPIEAMIDRDVLPISSRRRKDRCRRRSSPWRASPPAMNRDVRCCAISACASTTTTASRCSAQTATANRPCRSSLPSRLSPQDGQITRAAKLKIGYFAQHQLDELHPNESAYDHVRAPDAGSDARRRCGRAPAPSAFPPTEPTRQSPVSPAARKRGCCSGLQLSSVRISSFWTSRPTISISTAAPRWSMRSTTIPGAVILVSHDRYLLEACADRLWLVENGSVAPFDGDLEQYRRMVLRGDAPLRQRRGARPEPQLSKVDARRAAADRRAELAPLRQKIADGGKSHHQAQG